MLPCLSQFAWGFLDHLWSTLRQFRQLLTRQSWSNAENVDGLLVWMDSIIYILSGMFCDWSSCMHEWAMCIRNRACLHGWAMLFKLSSYRLRVCVRFVGFFLVITHVWIPVLFMWISKRARKTRAYAETQPHLHVYFFMSSWVLMLKPSVFCICSSCLSRATNIVSSAHDRVGRRVIVFQNKRMRRFLFGLICIPHNRVVNTHGKVWKRQKNCVGVFFNFFYHLY